MTEMHNYNDIKNMSSDKEILIADEFDYAGDPSIREED